MASIKAEDFIGELLPSSSLYLRSAAREAYYELLFCAISVCKINDVWFQELFDTVEQSGEDVKESVDAVLVDLSCNTRWIAKSTHSEN